jgi:hypothetical protein
MRIPPNRYVSAYGQIDMKDPSPAFVVFGKDADHTQHIEKQQTIWVVCGIVLEVCVLVCVRVGVYVCACVCACACVCGCVSGPRAVGMGPAWAVTRVRFVSPSLS